MKMPRVTNACGKVNALRWLRFRWLRLLVGEGRCANGLDEVGGATRRARIRTPGGAGFDEVVPRLAAVHTVVAVGHEQLLLSKGPLGDRYRDLPPHAEGANGKPRTRISGALRSTSSSMIGTTMGLGSRTSARRNRQGERGRISGTPPLRGRGHSESARSSDEGCGSARFRRGSDRSLGFAPGTRTGLLSL